MMSKALALLVEMSCWSLALTGRDLGVGYGWEKVFGLGAREAS